MKRCIWSIASVLFAAVLLLPACKGKEGPAGPEGTSYTPPASLCGSPSQQGYTVTGPSSINYIAQRLYACPVTIASATTAISLSQYVPSAAVSGQIRMGIYNDNAGEPGNLVVETAPQNLVASSWNTAQLPYNIYLPAATYWVAILCLYNTDYTYTATGGNYRYISGYGWAVLPGTFPAGTSGTRRFTQCINACP